MYTTASEILVTKSSTVPTVLFHEVNSDKANSQDASLISITILLNMNSDKFSKTCFERIKNLNKLYLLTNLKCEK